MLRPSFLLWEYLPKLRFVQFPWRWMGILAVPYAYFGAAAMGRRRAGWIWVCVVILVSAGTSGFLVHQAWWDSDDIPSLQDAIASDQGFEGTDEYDPVGDDHYNLPQNAPPLQILPADDSPDAAPKAQIRIARWTAEERDLNVTSLQPLRLAIRLLDYPAWRAQVDGRPVKPQSPETTAQIIVALPAGTKQIKLSFARTPDRIVGDLLSLAGTVIFLVLVSFKVAPPPTTS
jgi:hypothetical protein